MEFLFVGAIAGVLLALALARVIWIVISRAVDNLLAWAIYTFGNDRAIEDLTKRREERESGE